MEQNQSVEKPQTMAKALEENQTSDQAIIWNYIYSYSETFVLKCAVELDIATIIHKHGKPITLSELASQISLPNQPLINQDKLYRIMRHLVYLKVFTKSSELKEGDEATYGLAPVAEFLIKGTHKSMAPMLLTITDFIVSWHHIKHSLVVGNCTALEKAWGKSIWEYMSEHPEMSERFNEVMAADTTLMMSALISECRAMFEEIKSIVDVGGGTGTALVHIAKAFPHIKCTVYDLPHVIDEQSSSCNYPEIGRIGGDMFKYIPSADAVLIKCVLHNWGDEECVEILKQCRRAVNREGGKVIIVDIVLDLEKQSSHPYTKVRLCSDLDMMLNTRGKDRTEEEWKKLIYGAGYSAYSIVQIPAVQSVIVAYPH